MTYNFIKDWEAGSHDGLHDQRRNQSQRDATKTTRWLREAKVKVGREPTANDKMLLSQILSGGENIKIEWDRKHKTRRDKLCSQKKSRTIWKSDRHYSSSSQLSLRQRFLGFPPALRSISKALSSSIWTTGGRLQIIWWMDGAQLGLVRIIVLILVSVLKTTFHRVPIICSFNKWKL